MDVGGCGVYTVMAKELYFFFSQAEEEEEDDDKNNLSSASLGRTSSYCTWVNSVV